MNRVVGVESGGQEQIEANDRSLDPVVQPFVEVGVLLANHDVPSARDRMIYRLKFRFFFFFLSLNIFYIKINTNLVRATLGPKLAIDPKAVTTSLILPAHAQMVPSIL